MSFKNFDIQTQVLAIIFLIGISLNAFAQENQSLTEGSVSYLSGQNVYVKFASTAGITDGDTLFMGKEGKMIPVLLVQHRSSISCLCQPVGDIKFSLNDKILAIKKITKSEVQEITPVEKGEEVTATAIQAASGSEKLKTKEKSSQLITGRIAVSSYSNFSNVAENSHRLRYTLITNAGQPTQTKLSAESYISFTHKINEWEKVQTNLNSALKIYTLALRYNFGEKASLWAGRKINPAIANVGAVDGLQFEYRFGKLYTGVVTGFRPDYSDYSFNTALLEYGVYAGQNISLKNGSLQSSLAVFEQRNNGNTDRRFMYFQHSNSAVKNLNVFVSCELDLYKLADSVPKNEVSLTGLYLSARYRISKKIAVFGSYDNRKNVIYYETFRNYADDIIQLASRQGFRLNATYRPVNKLFFGLNAGTRFSKSDPRPTKTLSGYGTWSSIPALNASLTLSADLLQTSYLDGQVFGARLTKDFIKNKVQTVFNYRFTRFDYTSSLTNLVQNICEIDVSYQFSRKLFMSVNFETTFQPEQNFNRLYLNLRRKF